METFFAWLVLYLVAVLVFIPAMAGEDYLETVYYLLALTGLFVAVGAFVVLLTLALSWSLGVILNG